jgi:gliding motility-associated-like protein
MKKLNVTKNETVFLNGAEKLTMSKNNRWFFILMSVLIASNAYAQAPVLSYPGPKTYQAGQNVSLAPSSSGVAAFGYNSKTTPWGSGYTYVWGVGVDKAGNVYAGDQQSGIIEIPAGNGQPVILNGYSTNVGGITVDAAGDVLAISYEDNGGSEGATLGDLWELPAGGKPVVYLETVDADSDAQYLAADPAGDFFVVDLLYNYPNDQWSLSELPAGSTSLHQVNTGGVRLGLIPACDAAGDLFMAPGGLTTGLIEKPAGNGALINIANPYLYPRCITFDAAGNLYVVNTDISNGQYPLQMIPAGNLSAQPVTIGTGLQTATGIAIDGAGNIYESCYGNAPNQVLQFKPNGGYFITPALPAGLQFNSNTGVISGTPTAASPLTNYTITAYNGSGATSATVAIRVVGHVNLNLSNITLNAGALSPAFNTDSVNYTALEGPNQNGIFVTPTAVDSTAWIKVNGQGGVKSGSAVFVPLSTGPNTISIVVTGANATTKTYTINAIRGPYNANLSELHPNAGYLNQNFMPSVTSYTDSVNYNHTSVTITPVTVDASATIKINGMTVASGSASPAIPLKEGPNTITTVVTAGNGVTTKTYTITITRAYSTNANLSEMHPNAGHLNQYFTPVITSYTDTVNYTNTSVRITPVAQDTLATITVSGVAVASGSLSQAIALPVGNTVINTVVTAPDGVTTKTFTLTVTRSGPPPGAAPDAAFRPQGYDTEISGSQPEDDGILVHQAVSPNGDGINDFLQIENISQYPDNKLSIMNRNGQLIFETKGYDNSSKVFDGHSNRNGQMQLPGTYFYQLDYTVSGITKHKTGYLVLKY